MLNWPCIITFSDDAELVYIANQSEWDRHADLHHMEFAGADRLIDSSGCVYTLTRSNNGYVQPEASGDSASLAEILGLVKAHAAQQGSCCVAKLYAPTIRDAFRIVESLGT